jgi:uncharacterized protein (DUF488 family)
MIQLFTIGFTEKSARRFFSLLTEAGVKTVVDTRISNNSQLAGFAKGADLAYFAEAIGGMGYAHRTDYAPTKELLDRYRNKKIAWEEYEVEYLNLLDMRQTGKDLDIETLHRHCLLCSEHGPEKCHRRLLAEYLQHKFGNMEIIHLQ